MDYPYRVSPWERFELEEMDQDFSVSELYLIMKSQKEELDELLEQNEFLMREKANSRIQLATLAKNETSMMMGELNALKEKYETIVKQSDLRERQYNEVVREKNMFYTSHQRLRRVDEELNKLREEFTRVKQEHAVSKSKIEEFDVKSMKTDLLIESIKGKLNFLLKNGYKDNLSDQDCILYETLGSDLPEDMEDSQSNTLECLICCDKQREILFEPCRHFSTCKGCSVIVVKCPVCRANVMSKKEIYI
jgi:hypothetical protein